MASISLCQVHSAGLYTWAVAVFLFTASVVSAWPIPASKELGYRGAFFASAASSSSSTRRSSSSSSTSMVCLAEAAKLLALRPRHVSIVQHYTPDSVCPSDYTKATPAPAPRMLSGGMQSILLNKRQPASVVDLSLRPGCSDADLEGLMAAQPSDPVFCQWRMRCHYDDRRFPQTLYSAVLSDPEGTSKSYECRTVCQPIMKMLFVFRQQANASPTTRQDSYPDTILRQQQQQRQQPVPAACLQWEMALERVAVGFDCNGR